MQFCCYIYVALPSYIRYVKKLVITYGKEKYEIRVTTQCIVTLTCQKIYTLKTFLFKIILCHLKSIKSLCKYLYI